MSPERKAKLREAERYQLDVARKLYGEKHYKVAADEYERLRNYGRWMEALTLGLIQPTTPDQEHFLLVDRGQVEPTTIFERIWSRLKERRAFEEDDKIATHYRLYDEAEAWFPRGACWIYH